MTVFYMSCHLCNFDFDITKNSYTAGQESSEMSKQPIISFFGAHWKLHVRGRDKHSCPFSALPTSLSEMQHSRRAHFTGERLPVWGGLLSPVWDHGCSPSRANAPSPFYITHT